ncbi:TPA: ParB-like nuclease domain-containing protein [Klebsiella quasipneumoniae subsp. similipneumoniae]|nr:ParB-like nuclease domain-containing protein [Klebsiella quasipneumoniae subsp. similipneumoniae]HBT4827915.1 ParB-like nuclease domain-containing protein [Klebsiella quasipneumoniae subsp. similipneumoniae]
MKPDIVRIITEYIGEQKTLHHKIQAINEIRTLIHQLSPFSSEPVDCVLWVKAENVEANDYNPNVMAGVERKLLERSIEKDGFTQPVVTACQKGRYLVVDGFHRQLTGKTSPTIRERLHGYLPVTHISTTQQGLRDRIAATVRHNRARGKHQITGMSDIVRDLCRLGWNETQIGTELGMAPDEVLRLKQITGLAELFTEEEFSEAWTVE